MSTTYFSNHTGNRRPPRYTGMHRQRRRRPVYVSLAVLLAAAGIAR